MTGNTSGRRRPLLGAAATVLGLLTVIAPGVAVGQAATPERGWVTGTVLGLDGEPVAGALVNVLEPREVPELGVLDTQTDRRTWTGTDGTFRVREGRTGYLVQVCEPLPGQRDVCKSPAEGVPHLITYVGPAGVTDSWVTQTGLFGVSGTERDLGTVEVQPQGSVSGRVRGIAGGWVKVMRLNDTMAFQGPADAEGDYRIRGLAPGQYYVAAGGEGTLPWRSQVIDVRAGQDTVVDGVVRRGAVLRGTLSSGGKPVGFTDVLIRKVGQGLVAATTTGPRGGFRVSGMTPGTYKVGVLYHGSDYVPHGVRVTVPETTSVVDVPVTLRRGATITVPTRPVDGTAPGRVRDELRNAQGHAIQGWRNDGNGTLTYTGLPKGSYTVVAATDSHYAVRDVRVRRLRAHDLRPLRLEQRTLTLRGRTAPHAVVEAMTGDQCPPDGPARVGSFHEIEKADAEGRYVIRGLVPGTYMLGSDGAPGNYAPRCISDVKIWSSRRVALPLEVGGTAQGRLVYESTGTPVITSLSYELSYPAGLATNPTSEHPARARTVRATGRFSLNGLPAGSVTGELAESAKTPPISGKYLVIFPFQDGTPYFLSTERLPLEVAAGEHLALGDVPVTIHTNRAPD